MGAGRKSQVIERWPDESREAAQLVVDTYGEPQEATELVLTWSGVGPWKRLVVTRTFYPHVYPAPHIDAVESIIDYRVPPEKVIELAEFDGSVVVQCTVGEVSARCHDEQATFLALNLMNDIVTGQKTVAQARVYHAKEFIDARRGMPTPYMEKLRFAPSDGQVATRTLSDQDLEPAAHEGKQG